MAAAKKKLKTPPPQFLYGFKNNKDQVLIEPKFEIVGEFERGQDYTRAKVGEKWGLLSKTGDWACEPRFELIGKVFKNHFAFKSGLKWGLADTDGKEVAKAVFDDIISVGQNVFTVCQGKEFKILDFKSKEIAGGFDKFEESCRNSSGSLSQN